MDVTLQASIGMEEPLNKSNTADTFSQHQTTPQQTTPHHTTKPNKRTIQTSSNQSKHQLSF
jgi:hypothetical protein